MIWRGWYGGAFGVAAFALLAVLWWLHPVGVDAATITVTGTIDSVRVDGMTSLREAMESINAGGNVNADVAAVGAYGVDDRIAFAIPGEGRRMIAVQRALPALTRPVVIDGYSQPGANASDQASGKSPVILIALTGGNAAPNGFEIDAGAGGSTIRGFEITGFTANGILISGARGVTVSGNVIGTSATNTHGNGVGVAVLGGAVATMIGGAGPAGRNVISGNEIGVLLQGPGTAGTVVQGNYLGTDVAGRDAAANRHAGIVLFGGATGNTIGGTAPGACNVISGNPTGIVLQGADTTGNVVQANIIGMDAANARALPNGTGILLLGATGNTIGGRAAGGQNIVRGNAVGIRLERAGTTGNVVQGNVIGADGGDGIVLGAGATGNTIGGTDLAASNVITDNGIGIWFASSDAAGNVVQGNRVGTGVPDAASAAGTTGPAVTTPANGGASSLTGATR